MLDMICFLEFVEACLCTVMKSIFENVPCSFVKNVYFVSLGKSSLYQVSPFDLGHCSMPQYPC